MNTESTRIEAILALLERETDRKDRLNWEAVLADKALTPDANNPNFEQQFYDLLIKEMEDGYRRKETLQREKRKRAGRSGSYIPPQMRVTPDIGRFLFACFKWHGFQEAQTKAKVDPKGLDDLAEAFGFKIDVMENKRQFIGSDERETIIEKEESTKYNLRLWGMIIGGFIISVYAVFTYLRRRHGI